jgi:hypothetical protein
MPDYKQGKIYTVRCKTDDTLIYVGCTTQSLCERMAKHKYHYIYIHMCCVLIRPPIPYIPSSRCKRLRKFRPNRFLLIRIYAP